MTQVQCGDLRDKQKRPYLISFHYRNAVALRQNYILKVAVQLGIRVVSVFILWLEDEWMLGSEDGWVIVSAGDTKSDKTF